MRISDWSSDVCSSDLPYNGPDIIGDLLMSFTVTPLSPVLGAEVVGLDLSRPVHDADFARVRDAFHANGLLVFRDQSLSPEQQIAFSRRFGDRKSTRLNSSH